MQSFDEFLKLFDVYGGTDIPYLRHHYQRFTSTLSEFDRTWDRTRGRRLLDVGAHWLHQSLLWRRAGYEITAVDLPVTFELDNVRALAKGEDIRLVPCDDLEQAQPLKALPENSFDIVLFTEIFEHLTFNPVTFWREIHRLMSPGGRIIITTPNYYAWNGRAWDFTRFFKGFGGGISVDEVLGTHTYGHHWREYALHEVIRYFCLLSPDFNTVKAKTVRNYYALPASRRERLKGRLYEMIPGLRPNLHLEIELTSKQRGIVIEPSW